jgi:hypothetical protein
MRNADLEGLITDRLTKDSELLRPAVN